MGKFPPKYQIPPLRLRTQQPGDSVEGGFFFGIFRLCTLHRLCRRGGTELFADLPAQQPDQIAKDHTGQIMPQPEQHRVLQAEQAGGNEQRSQTVAGGFCPIIRTEAEDQTADQPEHTVQLPGDQPVGQTVGPRSQKGANDPLGEPFPDACLADLIAAQHRAAGEGRPHHAAVFVEIAQSQQKPHAQCKLELPEELGVGQPGLLYDAAEGQLPVLAPMLGIENGPADRKARQCQSATPPQQAPGHGISRQKHIGKGVKSCISHLGVLAGHVQDHKKCRHMDGDGPDRVDQRRQRRGQPQQSKDHRQIHQGIPDAIAQIHESDPQQDAQQGHRHTAVFTAESRRTRRDHKGGKNHQQQRTEGHGPQHFPPIGRGVGGADLLFQSGRIHLQRIIKVQGILHFQLVMILPFGRWPGRSGGTAPQIPAPSADTGCTEAAASARSRRPAPAPRFPSAAADSFAHPGAGAAG